MSNARSMIIDGGALTTQIPPLTVPQLVRRNALRYADRTAIVDGPTERRYSYAELDRLIGRFAAGIAALGFRPGRGTAAVHAESAAVAHRRARRHVGAWSGERRQLALRRRGARASAARGGSAIRPDHARVAPTVQEAVGKLSGVTIILTGEAPGTVSFASIIASTAPEPAAPGSAPDPAPGRRPDRRAHRCRSHRERAACPRA